MSEAQAVNVVWSGLGLLVITFLVFYGYPTTAVETFRSRIFEIRDQLFDDAASGLLPFDSMPYVYLRTVMNGLLRWGHRLTMIELASYGALSPKILATDAEPHISFRKAVDELPPDVAARLRSYEERMTLAVMKHLLFGSIIFLPFTLVVIAYMEAKRILGLAKAAVPQSSSKTQTVRTPSHIAAVRRHVSMPRVEQAAFLKGRQQLAA